jgi:formyl-CoA transferase
MRKDDLKTPLEGLKVIDLTTIVSGATTASFLADFGAEVIKVERPKAGDPLREWPPFKNEISLWWKVHSRNKKSITLNLSKKEGQDILKELVKDTDILIENFRPGVLERWNLGYDKLSEVNPKLIMLRVSGFGQDGPYKNRPGFGTIAEAMSGIVHITGFPDGPPILPAIPLADIVAGLFGTFSVMFAIYHRDVKGTGEGQYIDLSLYEPLFRMIVPQVIQYDQLNEVRERYGNRFPFAAPRNLYKTKDNKWVALSASAQAIFERVMKAIDKEELIEDSRFQDNESRVKNVEELDEIIGKWIGSHSMAEVLERFEEYEAVIGPVYDVSMMFEDPHYKARGNIMEFEDPELGKVKMQNVIPKFSRTPGKIESTGPKLGEHNEEIYLGRLGYTKEELSQLEERGIV